MTTVWQVLVVIGVAWLASVAACIVADELFYRSYR